MREADSYVGTSSLRTPDTETCGCLGGQGHLACEVADAARLLGFLACGCSGFIVGIIAGAFLL